jgi:hypothetical protein
MSVLARCSAVLIAAAILAGPEPAHAVADPDQTYSAEYVYPSNQSHICLTGNCFSKPPMYGATQSLDCDKAGLANPTLIGREPMVGTLNPPRSRGTTFFGKDDPNLYMLFPNYDGFSEWPGSSSGDTETGADKDPVKGMFEGFESLDDFWSWKDPALEGMSEEQRTEHYLKELEEVMGIKSSSVGSINAETPIGGFPDSQTPYINQQYNLNGTTYTSLMTDSTAIGDVLLGLNDAGISYQNNPCRRVLVPADPNYLRTGRHGGNSWGQLEDDQWAIKRVGFTDDEYSAWNLLPEAPAPVVVAVIDTGLDWHHLDIHADNIWRNEAEYPDNGVDDDNNGYVDDIIGWDFLGKHNRPWDFDGHGTLVTGIIAAKHNDVGIAGINPHVKIMVLKAVNNFGTTRASFIAEAIVYAVDNGAKVINISVGGPHSSFMEQAAIEYAQQEGVLVVAAAGNEGVELDDFGPGGNDYVLTVGATHVDDRAAAFSNYGDKVDLVAPGVDVLSLRARYTDANYRPDGVDDGEDEYTLGDNYVGDDKRYLHVSGTSFSTPIVAATASLLLSKYPDMSAADVERTLKQTATDVDFPGKDNYTGYGMIDAQAALSVDPDFSVTAEISQVQVPDGGRVGTVFVNGTVDANEFKRAWMQVGPGENPRTWTFVGPKHKFPVRSGTIGLVPGSVFAGGGLWQIVVNVEHRNGVVKRAAYSVTFE